MAPFGVLSCRSASTLPDVPAHDVGLPSVALRAVPPLCSRNHNHIRRPRPRPRHHLEVRGGAFVDDSDGIDGIEGIDDGGSSSLDEGGPPPEPSEGSSPSSASSPAAPAAASDADSILHSFEEELVRIRLQIEAEAEEQWESWRLQMVRERRRRGRRRRPRARRATEMEIEIDGVQEEGKDEEDGEEEAAESYDGAGSAMHGTECEDDDDDDDDDDDELLADASEAASESESFLLADDEEEASSQVGVGGAALLLEEDNEYEGSESLDDIPEPKEDGIVDDEQARMMADEEDSSTSTHSDGECVPSSVDTSSDDVHNVDGNDVDVRKDDTCAGIDFVGEYDAPTEPEDELSGHYWHHEEEFLIDDSIDPYSYSEHSEASDGDANAMVKEEESNTQEEGEDAEESTFAADSHNAVGGQQVEDEPVGLQVQKTSAGKRGRKKKKKAQQRKKKRRRRRARGSTSIAKESSDDQLMFPLSATEGLPDPSYSPSDTAVVQKKSVSFARKIIFYTGFVLFLSLFKMILDALVKWA